MLLICSGLHGFPFLGTEDKKNLQQRYLAWVFPVPLFSVRPYTHTSSPSISHHELEYSGLRNQCDRLVEDPAVEPGTDKQWQRANSFSNSAWTSPGKPAWDLIKYDSHKNADIASFLLGDNKGGRGARTQSGRRPRGCCS